MFGPAGHLYVYFTYGMHYCANVVTGGEGQGTAVLLRAVMPLDGIDVMSERATAGVDLADGPAKLCQAFAIGPSTTAPTCARRPTSVCSTTARRRRRAR